MDLDIEIILRTRKGKSKTAFCTMTLPEIKFTNSNIDKVLHSKSKFN